MRKWSTRIFALIALTLTVSVSAEPLNEKQVRRELKVWYDKTVSAYRNKDAKAFAALFTPDAEGVSWDGVHVSGRKQLEEYTRKDMANIEILHSAQELIHKVTIKGQEATIEATEKWKYKFRDDKGEYGPKGKSYTVNWKQRCLVTFVKSEQGWLEKTWKYLTKPDLRTEDGKPLLPVKK